jgi:transposase
LTTKIVVAATDENTAVAVEVLPGHRHEAPRLGAMLGRACARLGHVDQAVCDRGFDGAPQRGACTDRGIEPVIPPRSNRVEPEEYDAVAYRQRNRVERLFAKLKEFRRIATRYDKHKRMFRGWLHLVLGFIRLRSRTNVNRA